MHKVTKVFILVALSFISTHSSYANYANSNYGSNPNYRQAQVNYGQSAPDLNEEDGFMMQSRNRFNQMNQANRNMVQQDQKMKREGFDPNENYYNNSFNRSYVQYDRNNPYRNQEQMMRGNVRYSTQPRYINQGSEAGMPVSYPLEEGYSSVPSGYRPQRYGTSFQRGYYSSRPAPDYGYNFGYNDSRSDKGSTQAQSYPLNKNYPNAPRNDNQQRQQKKNSDNKQTSYYYQSSPYDSGEYIGDSANDASHSTSMNRGASRTNTNTGWDMTDDQAIDPSNSNTRSSFTNKPNTQR